MIKVAGTTFISITAPHQSQHTLFFIYIMKTSKESSTKKGVGFTNTVMDVVTSSDRWIREKLASVIHDLESTWFVGPTNSRAPEGDLFWFVVRSNQES